MITEEKWTVDDVHVQRGRVAVITYVEDFDWQWAPLLYSGVDLWLNTSKRPQEASGDQRHQSRSQRSAEPQHP
jgi:glucan phosphorylase